MENHENDIKWPNGLTFFHALTGRADDANKLLMGDSNNPNMNSDGSASASNLHSNEFLSLDSHSEGVRKMENKFKRSFTLPARMASSSSSTSLEPGMYNEVMENFLE